MTDASRLAPEPNTQTPDAAALIVAAGLSSRMGAFKPLLPLGESTLLRRGVGTLRAFGCAPIVVVLGREAERTEASLAGLGAECVFNPAYADCQMLDSVKLGLARLRGRCRRFFFLPGDVPLFSADSLARLLRAGDGPCCPLCGGRRGHPVLLPERMIPELLAYDGAGGLAGALRALGGLEEVCVDDPGALLDADTPEDYRRLLDYDRERNP